MSIPYISLEVYTEVPTTPRLYWFGLYDERDANTWKRFYQVDYAPSIGYFAKCVVGSGKRTPYWSCGIGIDIYEHTAMWLPLCSGNFVVIFSLFFSLYPWVGLTLTRYHILSGPVRGVAGFCFALCILLPWLGLSRFACTVASQVDLT